MLRTPTVCSSLALCTTEVTRGCFCTWNRHICYVLSCEPKFPKCVAVVCLLCSVWGFFPLQLPFWFSKPASARLLYLRCLIFMYDSFAEKKKRKKGKSSSSPSPPCFPYWFWSLVDVTPRQKCHLDESLLAQAGTAQHCWQKEEFHVDQINTDVK